MCNDKYEPSFVEHVQQCRRRSGVAERGAWSGSPLMQEFSQYKKKANKPYSNPLNASGLVQFIEMEGLMLMFSPGLSYLAAVISLWLNELQFEW